MGQTDVSLYWWNWAARSHYYWTITRPPSKDVPEYAKWAQDDYSLISKILGNISSDLVTQFLDYPTAKSLWDGLESLYSSDQDELQIYDLTVKENNLKQHKDSIETFYSKLTALWKEIDRRVPNLMTCPEDITTFNEITQKNRLYQFLSWLNDTFDKDRRDLVNREKLPTVEEAYAAVRREIAQREIMVSNEIENPTEIGSGLALKQSKPSNRKDDKAGL